MRCQLNRREREFPSRYSERNVFFSRSVFSLVANRDEGQTLSTMNNFSVRLTLSHDRDDILGNFCTLAFVHLRCVYL